jgi:ParB-like chromosome segregation protein Spo0J
MKHHPVTKLFPPMSEADYSRLRDSIRERGQEVPAWTFRGELIDGVHRERACQETGQTFRTKEWDGQGSLAAFVVAMNRDRRHLTVSQLGTVGVDLEVVLAEEAKERQREGGGDRTSAAGKKRGKALPAGLPEALGHTNGEAREQAAALVGVSARTVQDAKAVKEADPELFEQVKAGKVTVNAAAREVRERNKPPPPPPQYPHSDRIARWLDGVEGEWHYIDNELGGIKTLLAEPDKWDWLEMHRYLIGQLRDVHELWHRHQGPLRPGRRPAGAALVTPERN